MGGGKYAVCAPTHKAAILIGAVTVYNLFNLDTHTHTYLKSNVEKLKNAGVEHFFIDEISMINSKIWGVLSDIKKKYNFKFVLLGDIENNSSQLKKLHMMYKIARFSQNWQIVNYWN